MLTKRKYLFLIVFALIFVVLYLAGSNIFNWIFENYLSEEGIDVVKEQIENKSGFTIKDKESAFFDFKLVMRYAFYFVFFLFAFIYLSYVFESIDRVIARLEKKFDNLLKEIRSQRYSYTGRR